MKLTGPPGPVLSALDDHRVTALRTEEASLEEIFLTYYGGTSGPRVDDGAAVVQVMVRRPGRERHPERRGRWLDLSWRRGWPAARYATARSSSSSPSPCMVASVVASFSQADLSGSGGLGALVENPAVRALYGMPFDVSTAGGFAVWRAGTFICVIGALWGILARRGCSGVRRRPVAGTCC